MVSREQVPAGVIVAFASIGYLALLVAGLGIGSVLADADVITTRGVSLGAAYVAAAVALGSFALFLLGPLGRERPSFWFAGSTALGTAAAHVLTMGIAALIETGDLAVVGGVMDEVLIGWVSPVVLGTALIASWSAIAVRRTAARRPRWPWEDA